MPVDYQSGKDGEFRPMESVKFGIYVEEHGIGFEFEIKPNYVWFGSRYIRNGKSKIMYSARGDFQKSKPQSFHVKVERDMMSLTPRTMKKMWDVPDKVNNRIQAAAKVAVLKAAKYNPAYYKAAKRVCMMNDMVVKFQFIERERCAIRRYRGQIEWHPDDEYCRQRNEKYIKDSEKRIKELTKKINKLRDKIVASREAVVFALMKNAGMEAA